MAVFAHREAGSFLFTCRWIVVSVAVGIAYFAAIQVGLAFFYAQMGASLVWPAAGVALAVLLLFGLRMWPVLLVSASVAAWYADRPWPHVLLVPLVTTLASVTGAWLARRWGRLDIRLERLRDLLTLVPFAAAVSAGLSAALCTLLLCWVGNQSLADYVPNAASWWLGDLTGMLLITPLALVWLNRRHRPWRAASNTEVAMTFAALLIVATVTLGIWFEPIHLRVPVAAMMFPVLVWIGTRAGMRSATAAVFSTSALFLTAMAFRENTLEPQQFNQFLVIEWSFILIFGLTTLMVAASAAERARAQEESRANERRAWALMNATTESALLLDANSRIVALNDIAAKRLGLPASEIIGKQPWDVVSEEVASRREVHFQRALQTGEPVRYEDWRDAMCFDINLHPIQDERGTVTQVAVFGRDITEHKLHEEHLKSRERLLEAVANAAQRLVTGGPWRDEAEKVLAGLAQATQVSATYIYEVVTAENGRTTARQLAHWAGPRAKPRMLRPGVRFLDFEAQGLERWIGLLKARKTVAGTSLSLPKSETGSPFLDATQSIALAPVFAGSRWWGFLGFEVAGWTHEWRSTDLDELHVAASLIGGAIYRQQTLELLEDQKRSLEALLRAIPDPVFYKDKDLRYLGCNPAFSGFCGLTASEIEGKTARDLWDEESAAVYEEKDRLLLEQGGIQEYEAKAVRKDGRIRDVAFNKAVLADSAGEVSGIVGVFRDITERQLNEFALRLREEQFRVIFQESLDVIMVLDSETGSILRVSPAIERVLGYCEDELAGTRLQAIMPSHGRVTCGELLARVRSSERVFQAIPFVRADGSLCPVDVSAKAITWANRSAVLAMLRDVTDREHANQQIHALTREVLNAQETERRRIATELHDRIAQDLSALRIACETLFDDASAVPPEVRQRLERMSGLLQGAIVEVRELAYGLRPAGLEQLGLIRTLFEFCERFSEEASVAVDFGSAGIDENVLDRETRINLYRMAQEALNNVRKHADAAHVSVRVVMSYPDVILRVEDDGKGFDVQARMAAALTERRMGLRSMEERASLLEGLMRIESRPGEGTRIVVRIPCEKEHQRAG